MGDFATRNEVHALRPACFLWTRFTRFKIKIKIPHNSKSKRKGAGWFEFGGKAGTPTSSAIERDLS